MSTISIRHPLAPLRRRPEIDPQDLIDLRTRRFALSQRRMAKLIGVPYESYAKYERGVRIPSGSSALVLELLISNPDLIVNALPQYYTKERILQLRETYGFSQSVFAQLLNVSVSTVQKWESGVRKPCVAAAILLEILRTEGKNSLCETAKAPANFGPVPRTAKEARQRWPKAKKESPAPRKTPESSRHPAITNQLELTWA